MIQTAIILAAGLGSRLRSCLSDTNPKGSFVLPGLSHSLVERSIRLLLGHGIQHIIIGTGYSAGFYEGLAKLYPITCVKNPAYATTGSLRTLQRVLQAMPDTQPVLLLESDLLYTKRALAIAPSAYTTLLATPYYHYGDEVFIQTTWDDRVISMSKTTQSTTVLAGISRLSPDMLAAIQTLAAPDHWHYEDALLALDIPVLVQKTDQPIIEIDDPNHVTHATALWPRIQAADATVPRNLLLNPGPATTTDAVKQAQLVPDICPREAEFTQIMQACRQLLCDLVDGNSQDNRAVLLSGSGTAAVESMISSIMPASGHALIINQGSYGQRLIRMAQIYRIPHTVYSPDPLQAMPISGVEAYLKTGVYTHVFIVHHETSTGLLNQLDAIDTLCQQYQCVLAVDGMSAFGAVPVRLGGACQFYAASSNKNCQGMAGLGVILSTKPALDAIADYPKHSLYLDLYSDYAAVEKTGQCRFTPPVQCVYAFHAALLALQAEGVDNRYKRYQAAWDKLNMLMIDLGFQRDIPAAAHGKLISSFAYPDGFDFQHFHDYLYRRHITVYPGQLPGYKRFRIATIGDLSAADIAFISDSITAYSQMAL